jgi:adenosylhomocysteine nucleosidase
MENKVDTCVLISAGAEWRSFLPHFPEANPQTTPYGESFQRTINGQEVVCMHGGWGKVAAAGSTQYAIDRWRPKHIVNLGTCGGFSGQVERSAIILAAKTVVYDIIEQMGDYDQGIAQYTVEHDLSWLPDPPPQPVTIGTLASADRDILPADIPDLIRNYGAAVADWESGAIAWVAHQNGLPCLILRGVSDLVDESSGEAYGNYAFFEEQCQAIMGTLAKHLPDWLDSFKNCNK